MDVLYSKALTAGTRFCQARLAELWQRGRTATALQSSQLRSQAVVQGYQEDLAILLDRLGEMSFCLGKRMTFWDLVGNMGRECVPYRGYIGSIFPYSLLTRSKIICSKVGV